MKERLLSLLATAGLVVGLVMVLLPTSRALAWSSGGPPPNCTEAPPGCRTDPMTFLCETSLPAGVCTGATSCGCKSTKRLGCRCRAG
ncbi:MAG: hypothetical protein KatS3mg111_4000 [Pirellulaceae bacterium]|nr:MAG: hypothetical protein KatS3mg111_4000 [Pirellulaceae bacterium]